MTQALKISTAHIEELAALGFRDLANRATALRDELKRLGASQAIVTRCDGLAFKAAVGENEATARAALLSQSPDIE